MTTDQEFALDVARGLVRAGVPLFLATPDPARPTGYAEPYGWQRAPVDPSVVDHWRPGLALCAVMGHALDLVDLDPRNGARPLQEDLPAAYLEAETPSGGRHLFVAPLGLESRDGAWPGVDYKGGAPDGSGRGYAFIAPTVRASKVDGLPRPYRWLAVPDDLTADLARVREHDRSGAPLSDRIRELRAARPRAEAPRRLPESAARAELHRAAGALTADVRRWAATGWGGEAHAGLLRHSTHLARLAGDEAASWYVWAFHGAGVSPDEADLAKLATAIDQAVPDVVVPDEECDPQELFWAGVAVIEPPKADAPGALTRGRAPFEFYTDDDLDALEPPEAVVEGLLYRGTVARVFGPPNVGKTLLALDVAAHVANGMAWLGHPVKQGPSIYVYAEGATSSGERLRWWREEHHRPSGLLVWPEAVQVGGPSWDAFGAAVQAAGPMTVWLDTLRACTIGRSENDNDDMAYVMAVLRELAEAARACVVVLHHPGVVVTEGRARGASAMLAALDTELELAEGRHGLRLVTRKQRHAERAADVDLRLVRAHGGLVVSAPVGEAGALLGDDHDRRVSVLTERVRRYVETGGSVGKGGYREVLGKLRAELWETGEDPVTERLAREVTRAYARSIGRFVG